MPKIVKDEQDKRKQRSIAMSERELSFAENIMFFYKLRSISDVVRFLIIRENEAIEGKNLSTYEMRILSMNPHQAHREKKGCGATKLCLSGEFGEMPEFIEE